jgi:hypothetical protein
MYNTTNIWYALVSVASLMSTINAQDELNPGDNRFAPRKYGMCKPNESELQCRQRLLDKYGNRTMSDSEIKYEIDTQFNEPYRYQDFFEKSFATVIATGSAAYLLHRVWKWFTSRNSSATDTTQKTEPTTNNESTSPETSQRAQDTGSSENSAQSSGE